MKLTLLVSLFITSAFAQPTISPSNPTVAIGTSVQFTTNAAMPYWVIGGAGLIDARSGMYTAPAAMPVNGSVPLRVYDFLAPGMGQTMITLVANVAACGACKDGKDGKDGLNGKDGAPGPTGPAGPQGPAGATDKVFMFPDSVGIGLGGVSVEGKAQVFLDTTMTLFLVTAPIGPGPCPVMGFARKAGFFYVCDVDMQWGRIVLQKTW